MEYESSESAQPDTEAIGNAVDSRFRYAQVGRSVNGITHDINNYLGAAQAYAELVLLDRELSQESRRMVQEIVASSVKCSQIVNAMTNIARPPARDALNVVEAPDVLADLERLFAYTCRAARIRLVVEHPGELPSILASSAQLTLALVYLLWDTMDRFETTENEGPSPSIRITCRMEERHLAFAIGHSGPAFHDRREEDWDGAGAGAGAAAEIARRHEGTLSYIPGEGYVLRLARQLPSNHGWCES